MLRKVINRFFFIHYVFFDKFGIGLTAEYGSIFYLSLIISFPFITCLNRINPSVSFIFMALVYILVSVILYLKYVHKNKFLEIIKNQKPLKYFEIILSIFVSVLLFVIGFKIG